MADITFEIKKHIGNLTENEEGLWNTEFNVISWNGAAPKLDIRPWSPDHKMWKRNYIDWRRRKETS